MKPYYEAWSAGQHGHEGVPCVDCHVNPGFVPRLSHKFVALGEVWSHFFGNTSFPLQTPPDVPNARCIRCHATVAPELKNFSHALHASKGDCQDCHPTAGHTVTAAALRDAGVFNASITTTPFAQAVAVVNGGQPNLPGHVKVVCSRCHDMKATGCRPCHKPPDTTPHKQSSDCTLCHRPGRIFAFSHPSGATECATCHKPPRTHPKQASSKPCVLCHRPDSSWEFRHPGTSAQCPECHTAPKNHFGSQCASCHRRPGVSWSFAHPSVGEHSWRSIPCAKCHPNGYSSAYCSCHGGRPPND